MPVKPPEPNTQWHTNTTARAIADRLAGLDRVVVLTHAKPDGDAIGSTLALVRALRRAARARGAEPSQIRAWYDGPLPKWLDELADADEYSSIDAGGLDETDPQAVVVTDTGSWSQLDAAAVFLRTRADRTIVIDHHLDGNAEVAATRLIDTAAAAVCQPVCAVCVAVLGLGDASSLPAEIAEALYLGLATDTGWFRHPSVSPAVLGCGSELLAAGAPHTRLFRLIEQQYSAGRIRLMARAFESLELLCDQAVGIMMLTHEDINHAKALPGETSGFADMVLTVGSVTVCAVLTQADGPDGPHTKVSLRSKAGTVNVNEVARHLGGGGHAGAAGARPGLTLAQTRDRLVEILAGQV